MILTRIARALSNQKWSELGLELLVVIVGIFLGLQVDSWYQSRTEQKELATYSTALAEELATSAWMRGNYVRWHEKVLDGLQKSLDGLDGSPLEGEDLQLAYFGLTYVSDPPTSPQRIAVLRAMQNEGMLRLIEDAELRQLLGEILILTREGEQAQYERFIRTITAPPFSPETVRYDLDDEGFAVATNVDWDAARQDPAFRLRVLQGFGMYTNFLNTHRAIILIHEEALDILAKQGFTPERNWLEENQERLQEDRGN